MALGQLAAVDGHTVGLAVDIVKKVGVVILGEIDTVLQVIFRALQILDADEIRVLFFQPVIKSFFRGTANAVGAETDNPHS